MKFGRYLEEFTVGDRHKHDPGRTITESMSTLFCMLTGNFHPLHDNLEYAEGTQFGKNVVVGNLVLDIAFGMSVVDISGLAIANLSIDEARFLKPTFFNDTIHAETEVLEVRESKSQLDRGIVTVQTTVTNQRNETVMTFKRSVMVPKQPKQAA